MRYTPILIAILFLTASTRADERIEFRSKPINVVPSNESNDANTYLKAPEGPPYKIEIWGSGDYGDDGIGKDQAYNKFIFTDESYYFEGESDEGKEGRTVGNAEYYSGSIYDRTSLGDRFICDTHGVIERL